jgi:hypothetical protein
MRDDLKGPRAIFWLRAVFGGSPSAARRLVPLTRAAVLMGSGSPAFERPGSRARLLWEAPVART